MTCITDNKYSLASNDSDLDHNLFARDKYIEKYPTHKKPQWWARVRDYCDRSFAMKLSITHEGSLVFRRLFAYL